MASAEECLARLAAAGRKLSDEEQIAFFQRLRKAQADVKAGRLSDKEHALLGEQGDEAIDAARVAASRLADEADQFEKQAHQEVLRAAGEQSPAAAAALPKSPEVAELEAKLAAAQQQVEAVANEAGVAPPTSDGALIKQAETYDRAAHAVAVCLQGKGL